MPCPGAAMWIQVRTIDGSQTRTIEDVSRKATIEELRERVWALFDVRPECQRLFYRGKQVRRPAGSPGAGSRRPGTRLGVQGCAPLCSGWAAGGARDAGHGPAAVGPPPTSAPSGSEGRGAGRGVSRGSGHRHSPPRALGHPLPAFGAIGALERQQAPAAMPGRGRHELALFAALPRLL